jgi:hypothetical protein
MSPNCLVSAIFFMVGTDDELSATAESTQDRQLRLARQNEMRDQPNLLPYHLKSAHDWVKVVCVIVTI